MVRGLSWPWVWLQLAGWHFAFHGGSTFVLDRAVGTGAQIQICAPVPAPGPRSKTAGDGLGQRGGARVRALEVVSLLVSLPTFCHQRNRPVRLLVAPYSFVMNRCDMGGCPSRKAVGRVRGSRELEEQLSKAAATQCLTR